MAATAQTIEQVRSMAEQKYKYGFVTDIESDTAPKGLNEDIVRFISAKKNEPEWMLEWRLKAYRHWLTHGEKSRTGRKLRYPPIDYQDSYYYSAPKAKDGPKSLDEVDPELLADLREARHPAARSRRCWPASRSMPCSTASRSRPPSRRSWKRGHHLLLDLRGRAQASRSW